MSGIAWKINRLRAMSSPEVIHRAGRWFAQLIERRRVASGWKPVPDCTVGTRTQVFSPPDDWCSTWNSLYSLDCESLEAMLSGKLDLFSHKGLFVGQPVDWHRNPLTGQMSPKTFGKDIDYRDDRKVGDVKVLWELGRHQHLVPLAAGYAIAGNERYRDCAVQQIESWIDDNPYGIGIHWCSALEVSLRLISWVFVHGLLQISGHKRGLFSVVDDEQKLGTAIYQQAYFVRHYLSRYSSANNHLVGELCGLWITCQTFELGEQGDKWGRFACCELETEGRAQVFADGVSKEQAIYYHLWVLEYLFLSWLVSERSGKSFTPEYKERILQMSRFLRDISLEGCEPPQIGDADYGFVTRFEPTWPRQPFSEVLSAVTAVLGSERSTDRGPSQKAFWYSTIVGLRATDRVNTQPIYVPRYPIVYREGGYAILGDDSIRLIFDAGSLGYPSIAAHGHADALSVCLGIGREWWLVDPGTYAYHSESEWRDYFRGTSAHNTLVLNGENQSKIGGNFLWLRRANAGFDSHYRNLGGAQFISGWHDGYREFGCLHRREVRFEQSTRTVHIDDSIIPESKISSDVRVKLLLHFAADTEVVLGRNSWLVTKSSSSQSMTVHVSPQLECTVVKGKNSPIQGWYSPMIGSKFAAPVLECALSGRPPIQLATRICVA